MDFKPRLNKIRFAFQKEQTTVNLGVGLEKAVWSPGESAAAQERNG